MQPGAAFHTTARYLACAMLATALQVQAAAPAAAGAAKSMAATAGSHERVPSADAADTGPVAGDFNTPAQRYLDRVEELESAGGAYEYRLIEALTGLGLAYLGSGREADSAQLFERALLIIRVNQGLYSPEQLPVLDLLIQADTRRGDWESLVRNYQYMYWLSRRVYEPAEPGLLLARIARMSRWHLQAYLAGADPVPFKHLLWADRLLHEAVRVIESHYGNHDPRLINALNGIAITNYYIQSHVLHADAAAIEEIRTSSLQLERDENASNEYIARALYQESSNRAIKQALARVVEVTASKPDLGVEYQARALVNLGDWYFVNGWNGTAFKRYQAAYRLLAEKGTDRVALEALFGHPARAPSLMAATGTAPEQTGQDAGSPRIKLSFDVTPDGAARNIRILEQSDPGNLMARKRAREYLKSSLFRPRIVDGKPVAAESETIRLSGPILEYDGVREAADDSRGGRDGTRRVGSVGLATGTSMGHTHHTIVQQPGGIR